MIASLRTDDPQKVEAAKMIGLPCEDLPIELLRLIQVPPLMKTKSLVEEPSHLKGLFRR